MNGAEEPPFKRRRRMTILMLPDDLVLNCLARVSKLSYPILSLVSKRFRSIISSTELYQTRIHLGRTESCLYVCLWLYDDPNQIRWFTLCRGPINSKIMLVSISSPNFPLARQSGATMVGTNIYDTGGLTSYKDYNASSRVMVMDCHSHTWREAPSMRLGRLFHSTCVLDEKIYVIGGRKNLDSTNWIESFDTKTQTWKYFQIPSDDIFKGSEYKSVAYEGTVYVRSESKNVTYKLHKGRWRAADLMINSGLRLSSSHCVIENVFYYYNGRQIAWYDSEKRLWITLKGLERLESLYRFALVKLVDYGGKLAVLWQENVFVDKPIETRIWCAEIAIEKRRKGEIWGMVEWFDVVFTTNERFGLVHVLATTI